MKPDDPGKLKGANRGKERAKVMGNGKKLNKYRGHRKGWNGSGWKIEKATLGETVKAEMLPTCDELHLEAVEAATHAGKTATVGNERREPRARDD